MPGTLGKGVIISFGGPVSNTASYTPVAQLEDVTPPKKKVASVSIDAHDNPTFNGLPVEDTIPGWVNRGVFVFKMIHTKAQYGTLEAALGIPNWLKFQMPDGGGFVCQGYLDELGPQTPLKDKMTSEGQFMLSGTNNMAGFNTNQT